MYADLNRLPAKLVSENEVVKLPVHQNCISQLKSN